MRIKIIPSFSHILLVEKFGHCQYVRPYQDLIQVFGPLSITAQYTLYPSELNIELVIKQTSDLRQIEILFLCTHLYCTYVLCVFTFQKWKTLKTIIGCMTYFKTHIFVVLSKSRYMFQHQISICFLFNNEGTLAYSFLSFKLFIF